jgi:hypothetical protein
MSDHAARPAGFALHTCSFVPRVVEATRESPSPEGEGLRSLATGRGRA